MRIGYAFGRADLIAEVRRTLTVLPFSVNRIGQAAAIAALADQEFLGKVRASNTQCRQWFCRQLDRRGHRYIPSTTNFVAVQVDDAPKTQEVLASNYGILVRDTGTFGLPGYLRVSLGTKAEMRRLLDAFDRLSAGSDRPAHRSGPAPK